MIWSKLKLKKNIVYIQACIFRCMAQYPVHMVSNGTAPALDSTGSNYRKKNTLLLKSVGAPWPHIQYNTVEPYYLCDMVHVCGLWWLHWRHVSTQTCALYTHKTALSAPLSLEYEYKENDQEKCKKNFKQRARWSYALRLGMKIMWKGQQRTV